MPRQVLHKRHTGTTTTVADTGNPVTNGTNLQTAINAAVAGDTIVLTAGVEYRGNFTLPNKAGASYITITSSAASSLTAGVRVTSASAGNMAKLTTATGSPVLSFNASSHHWQLQALEVTTAAAFPNSTRTPALISQATFGYGTWPHHLTFDRCYVHALEEDPVPYRSAEEGFILDGADITYTNNCIMNFMGWEYPSNDNTVTAATNASPCQVTLQNAIADPGHKRLMYFTGATSGWTGLNGLKVASWVDSTHVTLENYDTSTFALSNVNSTTWGALSGTVRTLTQDIATSRALLIQIGPGPYTITNNFLEAYYSPLFTGGGGALVPAANVVTVSAVNSLSQVVLSGVGTLALGDLIAFSTTQDQTISTATSLAGDSTRTNLTVQAHQFPVGTVLYPEGQLTISGFTGTWAALNGGWGNQNNVGGLVGGSARVEDSTHISIPIDCSGFGAVTGSAMKWVATTKANSGFTQWQVGRVTNIVGTTVTYAWWGHQPSNTHGNGAGILVAVGATAQFNGTPLANLTVRHNTISNRRSWIWLLRDVAKSGDNIGSPPKAAWEAKAANTVDITGNVIQVEGGSLAPKMGVVGLALNQASQNGDTPWLSLNNWTVRSNHMKHYTYHKISMQEEYESGSVGSGFICDNNLCTPSSASFINFEGTDGVTVTHNTVRELGSGVAGVNGFTNAIRENTNVVFRDNIGYWGFAGYVTQASSTWAATPTNNFLIDELFNVGFTPPAGDTRVATDAAMLFVNLAAADADGDYHGYALQAGSPGHNAASDGHDVGVDFAALDAALA